MYVEPGDLRGSSGRDRWRASVGELFGGALSVGLVIALAFAPWAARREREPTSAMGSAQAKGDPTPTPVDAPVGLEVPEEPAVEVAPRAAPPPEPRRRRRARARPAPSGLEDVLRSAGELSGGA